MRIGRFLVLGAVASVAAISVWQASGDLGRSALLSSVRMSQQSQARGTQDLRVRLCRKYSAISPLRVKLEGKTLTLREDGRYGQVASIVRRALPGARLYVRGTISESFMYDVPRYVRDGAPADAVRLEVNEQRLPEEEAKVGLAAFQQVTVFDATGAEIGRWQGFLSGCASGPRDPLPLVTFLASLPAGASAPLRTGRRWQDVQFDVLSSKGRYVARPEDFTVPASSALCSAALVARSKARLPALEVTTQSGVVRFEYVDPQRTLPSVACSDDTTAVVFRTPTHVAVVALDREGYPYALGRAALKKDSEREVFRDVTIERGTLRATLVSFELDQKGTLAANGGRSLVVALGSAPAIAAEDSTPQTLGLVRLDGCSPPPAFSPGTEVHELSGVGVAWEYVQLPGQPPVPFSNIVVDAPLRSVAVSLPGAGRDLVWLIQATPGTDLRYVEISSAGPQTVLFRNPGEARVNMATDPSCPVLFARNSPSRDRYAIRPAYRKKGEREVINHVLLGNGSPLITAEETRRALASFGYQHYFSLSSYFMQLKAEGAIQDAMPDDVQRFRDYYYERMPLRRKIASWFRDDPAFKIRSQWNGSGYLVKRGFPLPKHPTNVIRETLLLVDKGVALPQGDIGDYLILDANTLSCPGEQRGCPWAQATQPR